MAKLTKTERRAVEALLVATNQTLEIDELVEEVYGRAKPASARSGMTAIMRSVIAKTENTDNPVVRASGLGRGIMAVYQIVH